MHDFSYSYTFEPWYDDDAGDMPWYDDDYYSYGSYGFGEFSFVTPSACQCLNFLSLVHRSVLSTYLPIYLSHVRVRSLLYPSS